MKTVRERQVAEYLQAEGESRALQIAVVEEEIDAYGPGGRCQEETDHPEGMRLRCNQGMTHDGPHTADVFGHLVWAWGE